MLTNHSAAAALNAGATTWLVQYPWDNNAGSGQRDGADARYLTLQALASKGRLAVNSLMYLQMIRRLQGVTVGSGSADDVAIQQAYVPYSMRGGGANVFAQTDVALITHAGGNTAADQAPTDLTPAEGTLSWDTSPTSTVNNSYWRKYGASGAGSWAKIDQKHLDEFGYAAEARMWGDMLAADEGFGPPFVCPIRLRCVADAVPGTVAGQLLWTGTAAQLDLVNYDGSAVIEYAVGAGGQITRTGTGTLLAGVKEMVCLAKGGSGNPGVLPSPVHIHTARAATVAAPQMRPVTAPGVMLVGREASGMTDGKKISFAYWFNTASLASGPSLSVLNRVGSPTTPLSIALTATGAVRLLAYDSANLLVGNLTSTGFTIPVNTNVWIVGSLDFATNLRTLYMGDTAGTLSAITNGANLPLGSVYQPNFFGSTPPRESFNGAALLTASGGKLGFLMVVDDYIDWSVAANRRALFDAAGSPATRTPYAAIGGISPRFEMWGDKGDWMWGSPDGSYGPKLLSPGGRIASLMS